MQLLVVVAAVVGKGCGSLKMWVVALLSARQWREVNKLWQQQKQDGQKSERGAERGGQRNKEVQCLPLCSHLELLLVSICPKFSL